MDGYYSDIASYVQSCGNGHSLDCNIVINRKRIGVICPECVLTRENSKVTLEDFNFVGGGGYREDENFYENGVLHHHRFGVWSAKWKCSSGHSGLVYKTHGCTEKCFHKGTKTIFSETSVSKKSLGEQFILTQYDVDILEVVGNENNIRLRVSVLGKIYSGELAEEK